MSDADRQFVVLGQISGLFGVRGWVKVFSHTEPRENILSYSPLYLRQGESWQPSKVIEGRRQGKAVVVHFAGIDDRDQAAVLIGTDIAVSREQLPALKADEYYWADLEGLRVINLEGVELGTVSHLFSTGANDVMVVGGERERMIPFVQGDYVRSVDVGKGKILVDWDEDF